MFTRDNQHLPRGRDFADYPPISDVLMQEEGEINLLLNIYVKKSPGPDGILNAFLKRYAEWVAKYLSIIFQSSINNGSVPKAWKIAKIVPIHKGGSVS